MKALYLVKKKSTIRHKTDTVNKKRRKSEWRNTTKKTLMNFLKGKENKVIQLSIVNAAREKESRE